MTIPTLELNNISHSFGSHQVIHSLFLTLEAGQIGCLLGKSGCGKTTVLRTIAGFEKPKEGVFSIAGQVVSDKNIHLPPAKRQIGMVFQDYALFPHLTVIKNITFGLKKRKAANDSRETRKMLSLVGLLEDKDKYPHELSGGQQQRVALARALIVRPRLLLMDEPFSNLDESLREHLSMEVRSILKKSGTTALFVTHNQHEAFAMADMIGVMQNGKLLQWGTASDLYSKPVNSFVASFIGEGKMISGYLKDKSTLITILGSNSGEFSSLFRTRDQEVSVLIRPEEISINEHSQTNATIVGRSFRGSNIMYELRLSNNEQIQALFPNSKDYQINQTLSICVNSSFENKVFTH